MSRPDYLADYREPPLDEVVMGVQFTPIQGYSSVHSYQVWQLFAEEFPIVEEQPSLPPQLEIFGGHNPSPGLHLQFGGPQSSRLWFTSADGSHLIQFQPDRLLLNWRRRVEQVPYPRFEQLLSNFLNKLEMLNDFVKSTGFDGLNITQVELNYVNFLPVGDFSEHPRWLKLFGGFPSDIESANASYAQIMFKDEGQPFARFRCQVNSAYGFDGTSKAYQVDLGVRGRPLGGGFQHVEDFLEMGRDKIVSTFTEISSDEAHVAWGRIK